MGGVTSKREMGQRVSARLIFVGTVVQQAYDFFFLMFMYLTMLGLNLGTQDLLVAVCELSCSMQELVPQWGIEPGPLPTEHGVLATGSPGMSPVRACTRCAFV